MCVNHIQHILVIDDDIKLGQLISAFLKQYAFQVTIAASVEEAKQLLVDQTFQAIIVDIMLPGEDGISFIKNNRQKIASPIILLTAKGTSDDRVLGLEVGADDYLTKPFEPKELVLRLKNLLQRQTISTSNEEYQTFGEFSFHHKKLQLLHHQEPVDLTTSETRLLKQFLDTPNEALDRYELAEACGLDPDGRALDVLVTRLRRKIEKDPSNPEFILTEFRKGYRFICI